MFEKLGQYIRYKKEQYATKIAIRNIQTSYAKYTEEKNSIGSKPREIVKELMQNPGDCNSFMNLGNECGKEGLPGTWSLLLVLHLWEINMNNLNHSENCLARTRRKNTNTYYPKANRSS